MSLNEISMNANGSGVSGPGNYIGELFTGYMLTITKPDGSIENQGPFTADTISNAFTFYTPNQLGEYKAQMSYPGQWVNGTPVSTTGWPATNIGDINMYYEPSVSNIATFTVQEEPLPSYPSSPLPTEYWDRPINALNREWSSISGDWLMNTGPTGTQINPRTPATNRYQPYGAAPSSGHIVWKKAIAMGGVVGGALGTENYYTGQSYETYFDPIIINGILYYNSLIPPATGFQAVDLRTGQELWHKDMLTTNVGGTEYTVASISLGQVLLYETGNQNGALPYLWYVSASRYAMINPFNGDLVTTIENALTGNAYTMDENGNLLAYRIINNRLIMWNSTECIGPASLTGAGFKEWRPNSNRVYDWNDGIMWNVSMPTPSSQSLLHLSYDDKVLVTYNDKQNTTTPLCTFTGYSAIDGHLLWQRNETGLFGFTYLYTGAGAMADGVFTINTGGDQTWYGFNLQTGEKMWSIPPASNATTWGTYDMTSVIDPELHTLYTTSYAGVVNAYNVQTGAFLWSYSGPKSNAETPYGVYPFGGLAGTIPMTIADGKLYAATGEHSPNSPLYRGEFVVALNETTGEVIWKEQGWWQFAAISDDYMVTLNGYDNAIYCFGKGRTETTVTVAPAINNPAQVLIQGSVTDQSPGQTGLGIPATGTPAVSEESMSQWMEYLYQQQPKPLDANGVPVSIDAIDPNGNFVHLGDTHSNSASKYAFLADQSMLSAGAGLYSIIATFSGSNSYFKSTAETAMAYNLPATTVAPTSAPQSVADMYFVPAVAGIIIAIIIVGAVLALILRKRP